MPLSELRRTWPGQRSSTPRGRHKSYWGSRSWPPLVPYLLKKWKSLEHRSSEPAAAALARLAPTRFLPLLADYILDSTNPYSRHRVAGIALHHGGLRHVMTGNQVAPHYPIPSVGAIAPTASVCTYRVQLASAQPNPGRQPPPGPTSRTNSSLCPRSGAPHRSAHKGPASIQSP